MLPSQMPTDAETACLIALHLAAPAQAELALHKREATALKSVKPQGRAEPRLPQDGRMEASEAGAQTEPEAGSEQLAVAQREAEELSTSLAKASSLIEVQSAATCPQPSTCSTSLTL